MAAAGLLVISCPSWETLSVLSQRQTQCACSVRCWTSCLALHRKQYTPTKAFIIIVVVVHSFLMIYVTAIFVYFCSTVSVVTTSIIVTFVQQHPQHLTSDYLLTSSHLAENLLILMQLGSRCRGEVGFREGCSPRWGRDLGRGMCPPHERSALMKLNKLSIELCQNWQRTCDISEADGVGWRHLTCRRL